MPPHLILTLPILVLMTWKWIEKISGLFWARYVGAMLCAIVLLGALIHTGSRGAMLSLLFACTIVLLIQVARHHKIKRIHTHLTYFSVILAVIMAAISLFIMFKGRNFESFTARFDYFIAAAQMFLQNPFLGVGLGEFYPWYMRLKPIGAEETRLAHNLILHFLSQCGLFGGIAAIYFCLQSILVNALVRKRVLSLSSPIMFYGVMIGCLGWGIHSLSDFNVQISGTLITYSVMPLLCLQFHLPQSVRISRIGRAAVYALCGILIIMGLFSYRRLQGQMSYQKLCIQFQSGHSIENLIQSTKKTSDDLPYSPYPWELLGKYSLSQKQYKVAENAFSKANLRAPHRAAYHAYRARCLLEVGQYSSALEAIQEALRWYPTKVDFKMIKDQISRKVENPLSNP